MQRRFSVIVPARDAGRFIGAAIRSVEAAAEGLDPAQIEVVVGVDRSVDDTVAVVEEVAAAMPFAVRMLKATGHGASAARNSAIGASTGDTLVFLDADDLLVRGAVRHHAAALDALRRDHPLGRGMTIGGVIEFTGDPPDPETSGRPVRHGPIPGTMAMDRSVIEDIGGFQVGEPLAEWPVTFDRLRRSGLPIATTPELVLLRRFHDRNLSRGSTEHLAGYARGLKQVLDERRRTATASSQGPTGDRA